MTAGKYAEACDAFDASQKLDPNLSTLVNQANCRERNDQLATAWRLFIDAEFRTRAATDTSIKELHQVVSARATGLRARLSMLTIRVPDGHRVRGLEILRDGHPIGPGAWGKALPVDGGRYKITARAPGSSDWSITVTVGIEGDARRIEIPRLATVASVPPIATSRVVPDEPAPAVHRRSIVPLAFAGGAVVLLGGAGVFALWGDRTYDRAVASTDSTTKLSLWHSANRKRYAAEVMLGAGIGCAGVAVWLWWRGRTESPQTTAARSRELRVAPLVNADMVGLDLERSW